MITDDIVQVPGSAVGHVDGKPTTALRVLRSEWIKMRTLRSTWITAASILILIVGFGVIAAMVAGGDIATDGTQAPAAGPGDTGPLSTVLVGANLAVLVVAVLGSIAGAREFGTGMIRTTLSAVPKRLPVLWAKLVAFTAVILPVVAIGVVVAFFVGTGVLDGSGADSVSWGDDNVARSVLGTAYYITGIGIIGLAIGVLLRSTAAAIGVVIGAVLFLPSLASALLPDSWDAVLSYLPSNAVTAFTSTATDGSTLSPGMGLLVFSAWIVLAVAGAAVALVRRDA